MSKNIHSEAVDHLFEAILSLKDKEECYREDRSIHSDDQPCEPFSDVRQRRV